MVIEIPIYVYLSRNHVQGLRAGLAAAICTTITHPLLWFVWVMVFPENYSAYIISGELLVAVCEGFIFWAIARRIDFARAMGISFIANGASYGAGVLVNLLGLI